MGATSVTRSFTALPATTLDKVQKAIENQIVKNNKFLFMIKKAGNWKKESGLGDRLRIPLMYELAPADSYSGYGTIDTTPTDGITNAFFDWRQAASTIAISGIEEAQNKGEEGYVKLLKAKTEQSVRGLEEFFNKAFLQGQAAVDATSIATAYTSAANGSSFVDPIGLLVKYDPTTSTTIGGINQSSNAWWRNVTKDDDSSTFAGFLKNLRNFYNNLSKGGGGSKGTPNFFLASQGAFELYESALASLHQNQSYAKADLPFDNVLLRGQPIAWDELMIDAKNADVTPDGSDAGTIYGLNTNYLGFTTEASHNFSTGEFVKPENQDARTAKILWYGASWTNQRRKQGVLAGITTTTAS
jgi:hypothetical protein